MLDEALSGLDVASETDVREPLDTLMNGRTTLLITHRLSSVREDEVVIVLGKGQVAYEGRYRGLMALPRNLGTTLREWEMHNAAS